MRLETFPKIEQGTDEWHALRRGIVTASTVGTLITPKTVKPASNDYSRGLTALLAAERITGWTEPTYTSDDMLRGILDEPLARDLYAETNGVTVEQLGFMRYSFDGCTIGYSPDGLVGDDGLIEIKSRKPKAHLATIIAGEPPLANLAQLQAGLIISGREWIDYISYCGGMPMWTCRVTPDERWHEAIIAAVEAAEEAIRLMVSGYHAAVEGLPDTERSIFDQEIQV